MRSATGSDVAYIEAVLAKFHNEEYYYTLEPPPLGSSPVDRFLFDTRRGFCEHYASAFAFLMRSAGIPARIVLGYQGGEINPLGGHLIVRQSDAHAWTEVWLPETGWYRVDPTAAVAPERIDYGTLDVAFDGLGATWGFAASSQLLHRLSLTLDALNARWNDWVLGYGPDTQKKFMEWLGMQDPDWRKMMLTLVTIVIALIILISGLLMLRYRKPAQDRAAILYWRFVKQTGMQPHLGETAADFARRVAVDGTLDRQSVNNVITAYLDARYGPADDASLLRLKNAVTAIG